MDELIAQADPVTGEIVGEVSKSLAHRDGIWHATVHVWILDREGHLIFQHRSPNKEHYPDMWDVSVAGHIRQGEDGAREVAEELGVVIELADLQFVGIATLDTALRDGRDREKPRVYLWRSDRTLDSFIFPDGEVVGLASVALDDLSPLLNGSRVTVTMFDGEQTQSGTLARHNIVTLSEQYWTLLRRAIQRAELT
ncbi:MAG: NUDIX domain-containing protein [Acidimicrobiaceae bacterium]|nr:NUDIX domain-containing protein [Acidimicrobiaceae bacterium]